MNRIWILWTAKMNSHPRVTCWENGMRINTRTANMSMMQTMMTTQQVCLMTLLTFLNIHWLQCPLYSDSEDEPANNSTVDIDPQVQLVDVTGNHSPPPNLADDQASDLPNAQIDIVHFPLTSAGAPIMNGHGAHQQAYYETYNTRMGDANGPYAPFYSKRWPKTHGPSASAVNELLAIDSVSISHSESTLLWLIMCQLSEMLGLSYKNAQELNIIMDSKLPPRPPFQAHDIEIVGETVTVHCWDIISSIRALYGDASFALHLIFRPEHHYEILGNGHHHRLYHDMYTGDWWWEVQVHTLVIYSKYWLILIIHRGHWKLWSQEQQWSHWSSPPTVLK